MVIDQKSIITVKAIIDDSKVVCFDLINNCIFNMSWMNFCWIIIFDCIVSFLIMKIINKLVNFVANLNDIKLCDFDVFLQSFVLSFVFKSWVSNQCNQKSKLLNWSFNELFACCAKRVQDLREDVKRIHFLFG